MSEKILIESLAMDLLRVALGLHRGSFAMAECFKKEALNREEELNSSDIKNDYLKKLLNQIKLVFKKSSQENADDILMYSILFQNFARKYYS